MAEPSAEELAHAADPAADAAPAGSHMDEDNALTPAFVRAVADAVDERDAENVRRLCADLHPADLADLLGLLREEERIALVELLGNTLSADVLAELDPDVRESVVATMPASQVAEAVVALDSDDAAFVLEDLDDDVRAGILAEVPAQERLALQATLDFEEESAGRLMQREVFAAPAYWTVGQVIDRMREADDLPERFYEIFVVDPAFKPVGAVPLATLLKSPRKESVQALVGDRELKTIPIGMDQEDVAYLFEQYNLISAPVVDPGGRLVGMITVDDVVEIVHEETHEDMLALAGVEAEEGLSDSVFETVRSRFSWLAVNLGTAILASAVIALFDGAIEKKVALAVLMPIVASMGGNAGTQTLTIAVRALATKDLTAANAARIVWREAFVGGVNGVLFAIIMGGLATLWSMTIGGPEPLAQAAVLGGIVGGAMIVNLLVAGLAGILVPISLQRAGADPAVSSAVFVTTVTDVVGFLTFLGLATVVLP